MNNEQPINALKDHHPAGKFDTTIGSIETGAVDSWIFSVLLLSLRTIN